MIKSVLTLLSMPVLSRAYGRIVAIQKPGFLVKALIRRFAAVYNIDMKDYRGSLSDYPSLQKFFVRPLNPETRPLTADPNAFLSPADGVLAELQEINTDAATQVKGWQYRVSQLTGMTEDWEKGWWLAVVYLSPSNYHRYHYPLDSRLDQLTHLGNRLFPVNRAGVNHIKNLFIRNERVTASFTAREHRFHVVAVGATFVGSIEMTAHSAPFTPGRRIPVNRQVRQNEEMGRFNMGSTLVILLPRDMASPAATPGTAVKTGSPLFRIV
ncbi:MAG: phosphatidylserine decarboxylase [Desulfobacter sp.]|nr:MAG: phosphatidylserine decarboxylase [Desulfobacter sp.]